MNIGRQTFGKYKSGMYLDHGIILDQLNQYIAKEFNKMTKEKQHFLEGLK